MDEFQETEKTDTDRWPALNGFTVPLGTYICSFCKTKFELIASDESMICPGCRNNLTEELTPPPTEDREPDEHLLGTKAMLPQLPERR